MTWFYEVYFFSENEHLEHRQSSKFKKKVLLFFYFPYRLQDSEGQNVFFRRAMRERRGRGKSRNMCKGHTDKDNGEN